MSKRFTDTEKWEDEWFLSLNNDSRIVWQFLLDKCTIAGCWKKNMSMLNFCCHVKWEEKTLIDVFDGRLIDMGSFFFIKKFVKFQYPLGLNSNKPAIIAVKKEVFDKGLETIIHQSFGNDYLIIKDKDKDKDTDKDKTVLFKTFKEYKEYYENEYHIGKISLEEKDMKIKEWK